MRLFIKNKYILITGGAFKVASYRAECKEQNVHDPSRVKAQFVIIHYDRKQDGRDTGRCLQLQSIKNDHQQCVIKLGQARMELAFLKSDRAFVHMEYFPYLEPWFEREEDCKLLTLGVSLHVYAPNVKKTTYYRQLQIHEQESRYLSSLHCLHYPRLWGEGGGTKHFRHLKYPICCYYVVLFARLYDGHFYKYCETF